MWNVTNMTMEKYKAAWDGFSFKKAERRRSRIPTQYEFFKREDMGPNPTKITRNAPKTKNPPDELINK